jgi:transposase
MVTLDSLVPKDHLLRKIDTVIDFSFIHDRVDGLYCADNGRPPLDPTLMFKALFIVYLFGIRSDVSWRARSRSMSPITGF